MSATARRPPSHRLKAYEAKGRAAAAREKPKRGALKTALAP